VISEGSRILTKLVISVVLIFAAASTQVNGGQTLKEKMTAPRDSVERENVRIWVSVERPNPCRLTVNILDSNHNVIRHMIDFPAPGGYHNFYWNKKDDSDRFVAPGVYNVEIDDCGNKKTARVKAEYKKWERESRVEFEKDTSGFVLELMEDSADVRVEWFNIKLKLLARLYLEDEMKKGTYYFNWTGDHDGKKIVLVPQFRHGFYIQQVKVGEFIHEDTIRWPGN
jgi:flagellar hook assembly protein FlgD